MNKYKAQELIDKYEQGLCNAEEMALVESWFIDALNKSEGIDEELDYVKKEREILNLLPVTAGKTKVKRLWLGIEVVAAAVAAVVFGLWFYNYNNKELLKQVQDVVYKNDVAPGKNTATLTLANGKVINLSDTKTGVVVGTELKYRDGTRVNTLVSSVGAEGIGMMLTASTPRGGTYQITLPDGTRVWLNADSKISFPAQFEVNERKVLLEGEAYFEVAKVLAPDRMRVPFIVATAKQEVSVLGTHFNINAYMDEHSTKTTLLEGSVRVAALADKVVVNRHSIKLLPGQQSIVNSSNRISMKEVDVNTVVDWKRGEFTFTDEPLEHIMRRVSRWYNVEIVYKDVDPEIRFVGTISRFEQLSNVLDVLQATGKVHFNIEGRSVTVTK